MVRSSSHNVKQALMTGVVANINPWAEVKRMATRPISKTETKLRLLLLEASDGGEDPIVWDIDWEMDNDVSALPGARAAR
jgi:hypothetical protein